MPGHTVSLAGATNNAIDHNDDGQICGPVRNRIAGSGRGQFEWVAAMISRRAFLRETALGIGAFVVAPSNFAYSEEAPPLLGAVKDMCDRLAPLGWRQLLLDATGGELDISATDLKQELAKPLMRIDRTYPGFGDFSLAGKSAIDPGNPERSLLYHALASPTVVSDRAGMELGGFPTLAELDLVENYVYGANAPRWEEIQSRANGRPIGIVVFAAQYQPAPMSVHGRHAEMCFARAGIARLGNLEPFYDERARNFVSVDETRPFDFRVMPRRFAPYLAVKMEGASAEFGPQDPLPEDKNLDFWVPLHKLFNGRECISGLNLQVELGCGLRNDGIAQFHRFLDLKGLQNNWRGEVLENHPFTIKDSMIGSLSERPELGEGVLEPRANPLITAAQYEGRMLTFPVDGRYTSLESHMQLSGMQVILSGTDDDGDEPDEPRYMLDAMQETQRPAPQFINIRHRVLANGQIENLNARTDMDSIIKEGGYQALHYHDGAGDGWVEARCPQLEPRVDAVLSAYCMIGLPDFFPKVTQRDLMVWWRTKVPQPVRASLWAILPLALSQTRIAANITLPAGFSLEDRTMTAIVSQPAPQTDSRQEPNGPWEVQKTGLPDGSPGLFDPGWDTSQSVHYSNPGEPVQKFLSGYGLGSPFIEDAKLCAALGAYWPGIAPDSTRSFPPDKRIDGNFYPYPTIVPLTDQEIGSAPLANGEYLPWDGVRGPQYVTIEGKTVAAYPNPYRTDYIDIVGTMTAALTSRIDLPEYKARIMAMAAVYWALGIHDPEFVMKHGEEAATYKVIQAKAAWAVMSFRVVDAADAAMRAAEQVAKMELTGERRYAFQIYRWGKELPNPNELHTVLVEVLEQANAYVSDSTVLIQRDNGAWTIDRSMPT